MSELPPRTNGLRTGLKWLAACTVSVGFSSALRESDLGVDRIDVAEKALFNVRSEDVIPQRRSTRDESFMAILLTILEFLLGCHHPNLSRVFTLQGETYRVCCDCGARFAYSLVTMSIVRRLPLTPVSTRFRIA
jgi:hypothetical protein